jgi:flagellar biosynthesis protein FlhG
MVADQAEALRELAERSRQDRATRTPVRIGRPKHVIAFSSGKGGVGKTTIVTNLAIGLSESGYKVLIFDADLGLANVDLLLNISPRYTLGHVIRGEVSLADAIMTGPKGVMVVPGGSGMKELADLPALRRQELISSVLQLQQYADLLLLDTGAGVSSTVLDFVTSADLAAIVTTPEPTALADAYALIKLAHRQGQRNFSIIVNTAKNPQSATNTAGALVSVAKRFLNLDLGYLGFVPADPGVPASIREQIPFISSRSGSPAAVGVLSLRESLLRRLREYPISSPVGAARR